MSDNELSIMNYKVTKSYPPRPHMRTVNVHEAKTHLSRLLERVAAGEEVVIAKAGRPVARLIAFGETPDQRVLGRDAGLFEVPENFDDPLPDEVAAVFEQ